MAEPQRAVVWTQGAQTELDEIVAYIEKDSPSAALALLEEVLESAESLTTLAKRGRVVPELQDLRVRELFIKSYRLFYEIQEREVQVLGIIHGAREFTHKGRR